MEFKKPLKRETAVEQFAYDAFLTHDWGSDELGRNNHARVTEVYKALKQLGLNPWFDEEMMEGDINDKMANGVENSATIVVFITERYVVKASGRGELKNDDNCKYEFDHSCRIRGVDKMIVCVMEPQMRSTAVWKGSVGGKLGGKLYHDLCDDGEKFAASILKLAAEIAKLSGATVKIPEAEVAQPEADSEVASILGNMSTLYSKPTQKTAHATTLAALDMPQACALLGLLRAQDSVIAKAREVGITGEMLAAATEDDLKELGVSLSLSRRTIRAKLQEFNDGGLPDYIVESMLDEATQAQDLADQKQLEKEREEQGKAAVQGLCRKLNCTQRDLFAAGPELELIGNRLNDDDAMALAHLLEQANFTRLSLSTNLITDVGALALGHAMAGTKHVLGSLGLIRNKVSIEGAKKLVELVESRADTQIQSLCGAEDGDYSYDLAEQINGDADVVLVCYDIKMNHVMGLNLASCRITDVGAKMLGTAIANPLCIINFLDLSGNRIGDPGATALATGLKTNTSIVQLALASNIGRAIGDASAEAFAEMLKANKSSELKTLHLEETRFTVTGARKLMQAANDNSMLEELHIDGCARRASVAGRAVRPRARRRARLTTRPPADPLPPSTPPLRARLDLRIIRPRAAGCSCRRRMPCSCITTTRASRMWSSTRELAWLVSGIPHGYWVGHVPGAAVCVHTTDTDGGRLPMTSYLCVYLCIVRARCCRALDCMRTCNALAWRTSGAPDRYRPSADTATVRARRARGSCGLCPPPRLLTHGLLLLTADVSLLSLSC
jgi:hypothetical protein